MRAEIRRTAQGLFAQHGFEAVTIADVAAAADVAVQTVFNHFPTKEELFFDERTPWVDGPAEAVRSRRPDRDPLAVLRGHTVQWIREAAEGTDSEERRSYLATLMGSSSLMAFELGLEQRAEKALSTALAEVWSACPSAGRRALDIRLAADLTAALWFAGARTLLTELRTVDDLDDDAAATRALVAQLADRLFERLETGLATLLDLPDAVAAARMRRGPAEPGRLSRPPQTRASSADGATIGISTSSTTRCTRDWVIAPSPAAV
jgi:AcrR family transcriptional regulator